MHDQVTAKLRYDIVTEENVYSTKVCVCVCVCVCVHYPLNLFAGSQLISLFQLVTAAVQHVDQILLTKLHGTVQINS